jgi:hypothetical protein
LPKMEFDESFDNYCIICDKLIITPEPVVEEVKQEAKPAKEVKPKKKPAGCIRVSSDSTS